MPKDARNELIHIEHPTEEQLDLLGGRHRKLAGRHRGPSDGPAADDPRRPASP